MLVECVPVQKQNKKNSGVGFVHNLQHLVKRKHVCLYEL